MFVDMCESILMENCRLFDVGRHVRKHFDKNCQLFDVCRQVQKHFDKKLSNFTISILIFFHLNKREMMNKQFYIFC